MRCFFAEANSFLFHRYDACGVCNGTSDCVPIKVCIFVVEKTNKQTHAVFCLAVVCESRIDVVHVGVSDTTKNKNVDGIAGLSQKK
jgi:hypothetical protein